MSEYKVDRNFEIFSNAVKKLQLRFPVADIAMKTGFQKGSVSNFLNKKTTVSDNFLQTFKEAFNLDDTFFKYELNENLENLTNEPDQHTKYKNTGTYYPDVNVSAGMKAIMDNSNELNKIPISIPFWGKDLDFINIFGDSMYPKFCAGEIIGIKAIQKEFVNFGYAYVIILKDGEVYLKYIKKGKDDNHWTLASENPKYEPKEFHIKMIDKIFIVKGVLSKITM